MAKQQLPQNPGMAVLPSGRPFHFMSVIDAQVEGDVDNKQIRFVQTVPGGTREVLLEGDDAGMALRMVHDVCLFDGRKVPSEAAAGIVVARTEPPRPQSRK